MIKKIDEPGYLYTETNNSYMLEPCVPYKTLTWTFTPTKSGQYAAEIYDLVGSQMGVGFTAKSLLLCTSDRTACFQEEYTCDPALWECADTENIFNTVIDSPLKQFKSGIPSQQVSCKEGLDLVIKKSNGYPICVKPYTKSKLLQDRVVEQPLITEEGFVIQKEDHTFKSSLTIEGLNEIYSVGQKIEFTIKFDGIWHDCGVPRLRIEDINHKQVWEGGLVVSICDPDMKKDHIKKEWTVDDNSNLGVSVIDKEGFYTLFATFGDDIIQRSFWIK